MDASAPSVSSPVSVGEFRNGMALLPGAVTVITTDGPEGPAGFTASAVCSVTDSPPTVLVCMNRSSFAHRFFAANGVLCVNVLSAAQQDVSGLFANREVAMAERFARCPTQTLATGAPALAGALVNLDGRIVATHEVGTHSVFIVELQRIQVPDGATALPGLAYFNRGYHALGQAAA
ncbi:flavin reductase [Ideonella benzenivorans]|uniref:flavin reductase n=1 Tax=Ideonella benzenivorans TaxID=2831643 RepID=UPI001CECDF2A|nr:flavin reductase [Ideonella benzenivorans]